MTLFTDNFNRADSNLEDSPISSGGGTWTHDGLIAGALTIGSNLLRCGTTNTTGSAYWAADHGTKNQYVQFDAVSTQNTTGSFFCCRLGDRNNFVGIRCGLSSGTGQIEVYTRIAGTFANLYRSSNNFYVNGDTLRLEVQDGSFTVYKNNVQISTGSIGDGGALDTNTKSGVLARSNAVGIGDNFQTDSLTVSGNTAVSLTASGISSQPALGTSTITQNHSVSANGLSSQPLINESSLTQNYIFGAEGISTTPILNVGFLTEDYELIAEGVSSTFIIGTPLFSQDYKLISVGSIVVPSIIQPSISQNDSLSATGLLFTANVNQSEIQQNQILGGIGLSFSFVESQPDVSFAVGQKDFFADGLSFTFVVGSPSLLGEQTYSASFTYKYYQATFMQTNSIDVENRIENINIGIIGTPDDENDDYSLNNLFGD